MDQARIAELERRGVVAVRGPDAKAFLNNLVTVEIDRAETAGAAYGALLTPQGKILFDFILFPIADGYLLDLPRSAVPEALKRFALYKLRAKVEIADLSEEKIAVAAWNSPVPPIVDGPVAADPRLAALGYRAIVPPGADMAPDFTEATEAEYDAHRIALGVPEGGIDFGFGESFPHDANMDQLNGVDFDKGCYIGQEVVSRMQHRGTARRRIIHVTGAGLASGAPITANDKPVGAIASTDGANGIALARLDRAREATDANVPLMAAGAPIQLAIPAWASFDWLKDGNTE